MAERLLIIGNGMASVRLVEALVRRDPTRFAITIVGEEPDAGYNRVLLSALLAQDVGRADVALRDRAWYGLKGVTLITGDAVTAIDGDNRVATTASGQTIPFDACVFATGSAPTRLPISGVGLPGVMAFRTLADVAVMERAAVKGERVAVIGGGLLGIEAAYGLARRGADVTLVHVMDRLMERQLDARAALFVKRALATRRVKVRLATRTTAIAGKDRAVGLLFDDGGTLDADTIVCAVGITPRAELAAAAGLSVKRGIVVDDQLRASRPGFYAIGECAEHRGTVYGLVEPAYVQAEALAATLCGLSDAFEGMVLATNLKVSGVPVFSAGDFMGGEGTTAATLEDRAHGIYRKLVFRGPRLVGCVLVGDADDALWYLDLIRNGTSIASMRSVLVHGRDVAQPETGKAA
jgi:nitrite reductase (NADH) large subunit